MFDELVNAGQQAELASGRERGFGLVEDIKPVAKKAIHQQRQKGFAVGLLMKRHASVASCYAEPVDLRRHVEEGFGTQEIAVRGIACRANEVEEQRPFALLIAAHGLEPEILRAAFFIESRRDGERFDDR